MVISAESTRNKYKWHEQINSMEEGIPVTRFYFNHALNLTFLNLYIRFVLLIYFAELILIKRFYPNIIHIHFHQSFFWAKLYAGFFKIPLIITEHWSAFLGWPDIGKLRYKKAAEAFNKARKVIPVSSKIQKGITDYTGAKISHKSTIIPNTVDTNIFDNNKKTDKKDDCKNLIFVGRNAEEKDIPTLLKGIAEIIKRERNCMLHMIGDGTYYPIEKLIKEHGLQANVIQYGQQNKAFISELMNTCEVLLLTSTIENSPCVIGEAHCCGVPVVATDVGGISELIIEGDLFEPGNHIQMAEKVIECLRRPINKKELAAKASQKFGYESIGQQLYNVYREICVG